MKITQYIKKEDLVDNVFFVVILGFLIRATFYYYQIILFPFQLEFREGVAPLMTNAFLSGTNTYAEVNQPLLTNLYGFLYSTILLPFSLYFGSSLFTHRLISYLFILLCCLIVFDICYRMGKSFLYSLCASTILYETFLEHTISLAFPNSMGIFLMLLSAYVPWKFNFNKKSLFLCITFGISAFFTKIYFIFGSICVAIYLTFFVSKKKGTIFSLILMATTVIMIVIVNKFFDFYFENTIMIIIYLNAVFHSSVIHLAKQVCYFLILYSGLFIIIALIIIKRCKILHGDIPYIIKRCNLREICSVIIKNSQGIQLYQLCFILSCLIMLSLGLNRGAFFSYFAQITTPFMLIIFFKEFSKDLVNRKIQILLLIATLFMVAYRYPRHTDFYEPFNRLQFSSLVNIVQSHNKMFNSPSIVSIFMESEKSITDSGQTEYLIYANTERAIRIYTEYLNDISFKINQEYYDVIFEYSEVINDQAKKNKIDMSKFYKIWKEVKIKMLQEVWEVVIWQRRNHAD